MASNRAKRKNDITVCIVIILIAMIVFSVGDVIIGTIKDGITRRKLQNRYDKGWELIESGDYSDALLIFSDFEMSEYKDSKSLELYCRARDWYY